MRALILMAHGSRNQTSNQEVVDLTDHIRGLLKDQEVTHAFLDVLPPTLPITIERLVKSGVEEIAVLPLFLNSGNHVEMDIPEMIRRNRNQFPKVKLELLKHIGAHPQYLQLVLNEAQHIENFVMPI